MRFISAFSSGRTGATLAQGLAGFGEVTVLGSPEAIGRLDRDNITFIEEYGSTRDLLERMKRWCLAHPTGAVLHAAAVGDYEATPEQGKMASGRPEWTVTFRPTPKIADQIREWMPDGLLVTFKAAPPETTAQALTDIARRQLLRTQSDWVFANVIGALESGVQIVEARAAESFSDRRHALQMLCERVRQA
jgi:phosphopantothenoylcysteine synthetase/decarboxylase